MDRLDPFDKRADREIVAAQIELRVIAIKCSVTEKDEPERRRTLRRVSVCRLFRLPITSRSRPSSG
jgi:hypothetical protein